MTRPDPARPPGSSRPRYVLPAIGAAVAVAVAGAVWLQMHRPPSEATAAADAAPSPTPAQPAASAEITGTEAMALPHATQASARPTPSAPPTPGKTTAGAQSWEESPAESLRKVQQALNGGSPDEVLAAAATLQHCSTASKGPDALFAIRDQPDQLAPPIKKMLEDMGGGAGVTNEQIAFAQREQRRCQVFDAATMSRRGELYQRAYEGGAAGSAIAYLQWLQDPIEHKVTDPALIAKLQADARKAAEAGDSNSLMAFAMNGSDGAYGTTPTQRLAYKNAWLAIQEERAPGSSKGMEKMIDAVAGMIPQTPLSAAQQREAATLTQQVVDAWRRGRKS